MAGFGVTFAPEAIRHAAFCPSLAAAGGRRSSGAALAHAPSGSKNKIALSGSEHRP